MARILALGLDPGCVDPGAFGGFTPDQVRAFIESQLELIRVAGYEVVNCLVDQGETALVVAERALTKCTFDCVLIGAGLRAPSQLLLFERLLNLVHRCAPRANLCFNSQPADSLDAVRRWV